MCIPTSDAAVSAGEGVFLTDFYNAMVANTFPALKNWSLAGVPTACETPWEGLICSPVAGNLYKIIGLQLAESRPLWNASGIDSSIDQSDLTVRTVKCRFMTLGPSSRSHVSRVSFLFASC